VKHRGRALRRRYGRAALRRGLDDRIFDIRARAGNPGTHCPKCSQSVGHPHRRKDAHGRIVEGCIDACHKPHISGESLKWHMRPSAVAHRKDVLAHLESIVGG
jgi:hypothetical protein